MWRKHILAKIAYSIYCINRCTKVLQNNCVITSTNKAIATVLKV